MTDTPIQVTPVEQVPAATAPAPDTSIQVTPSPQEPVQSIVEAPAVTPAPTLETPPQVTPEAPKDPVSAPAEKAVETLLGEDKTPTVEAVKPPETTPTAEAVKENTEGVQTDDPAPPPTYEPFKLPEDIKLDEARVSDFTKLLSELELDGKANHDAVQQFGQKAVEFHISEVKKAVDDYQKVIYDTWDKQKTDWKDQFLKDPEIGGNRWETTVTAARNFIRNHGGTAEQQAEFRTVMETSGLGNHPAVIRTLANAYRDLQEGKPLAATLPVQAPKSKTQTLYGKDK